MPAPSRPRLLTAGVLVALALGPLAGCSGDEPAGDEPPADAQAINPFADRAGYADPDSHAAQAAAAADESSKPVFARLSNVPQGIWLTPEEYPAGSVGPFVAGIVAAADEADQVPTFVIYGIPDRDCSGQFSAGGLPAAQYTPWVAEIAAAAGAGERAVAVVEPDALASALECDNRGERVRLIGDAVAELKEANVTTYVDGGHSNWIAPADLADLLEQVGVRDVRGFATNVSNFQTDQDEQAFAEELSAILGSAHYVIDSGRNGVGATDEWCNPPGRAFGTEPVAAGENDPEHQDAYLWVKPPGESDGDCGGGPPAGDFWPERALEMATTSGW
ncbi:glycoside hydrolase family 6 protein [Nocardioides sp. SR21]|uniref:glycoside hydrolase family 6 protein n=1 Tax=Nocardioides sp. SR21 TaxID=2919501 RepID=UPI001FAAE0A0|nr:glycoside hydrolase family 6 protein [Nocardioides sp. SR21]